MKTAAIVILYNPDQTVANNIQSYANKLDFIILVDNSTEEYKFRENYTENEKFYYIHLKENLGIATALNIGIKKAIDLNCEWVLTMDQDSSFSNDIISIYKKFLESQNCKEIGILCPTFLFDRRKNKKQTNDFQPIKRTMQSANFLKIECYKEIGPFNDELFIDCVDYDYCFRLSLNNYKIIQCSKAYLKHSPATTRSCTFLGRTLFKYGFASPLRYYYQARNILYLVTRYKSFDMFILLCIKLLKILLLFNNKKEFLNYFFTGVNDCIHNKFGKKQ